MPQRLPQPTFAIVVVEQKEHHRCGTGVIIFLRHTVKFFVVAPSKLTETRQPAQAQLAEA